MERCQKHIKTQCPMPCPVCLIEERDELQAELAKIKTIFEPIRSWYDGDGRRSDICEMLKDAVADLQQDRAAVLKLQAELKILKEKITFRDEYAGRKHKKYEELQAEKKELKDAISRAITILPLAKDRVVLDELLKVERKWQVLKGE